MRYEKGDKLVSAENGETWEVIMTDKEGTMIILSEGGMTREEPDEDPVGFIPFEEVNQIEEIAFHPMNIKTLDEIRFDLYIKHLEMSNFDVDKAIQKTRAVMFGVYHDKEALDI